MSQFSYIKRDIMLLSDRVIYARKEGEASSGSVLEAGEKITLDQASVSLITLISQHFIGIFLFHSHSYTQYNFEIIYLF